MVRAEHTNIRTTGKDTYHSTMFKLLLELNVICGQRWIQCEWQNSLSRAFVVDGKITLPFRQFNDRANQFFGHKSPAARVRELFKPSADSASLLVKIEKNNFQFRWEVFWR